MGAGLHDSAVYRRLEALLSDGAGEGTRLQRVCDLLTDTVDRFSWVGFYLAYEESSELLLGPFSGAPTEHTVIPYGRGVCGRVAAAHRSLVVEDVTAEENYLSCSISTRSEVVIPMFHDSEFVAVLDVDSDQTGPFEPSLIELLNVVADRAAASASAIVPRG